MEENGKKDQRDDVFSKHVRAGKRTYFFDVKATRAQDYYLTITESTKKTDENGSFFYKKHRIFLYKEDFEKFSDGLSEVVEFVFNEKGKDPIRNVNQNATPQNLEAGEVKSSQNDIVNASDSETEKSENPESNQIIDDAHEEAIANASKGDKTETN